MSDHSNGGARDGDRISLTESHEVRYWTKALGGSGGVADESPSPGPPPKRR